MKFNALVVAAMVLPRSMQLGREDSWVALGSVVGQDQNLHRTGQMMIRNQKIQKTQQTMTWNQDFQREYHGINRYDKTQDPDTIKEGGDNGSNALKVDVERLCCRLMVDLEHSYEQMVGIVYGAKGLQSASSTLNDRRNSLKPGAQYPTLQRQFTFEQKEEKKQRERFLKKKYNKDRKGFDANKCSDNYPELLSKDDVKRMDKFIQLPSDVPTSIRHYERGADILGDQ
ncbi:hypothetical protein BASA60_007631 [Batrachochytrium salamandrivorans]|nr:hypothetical protein BASA60_007631 [Batrachochytrium salamandrivorans]